MELTIHQILGPVRFRGRLRGPRELPAHRSSHPELLAQPLHGAPGYASSVLLPVLCPVQLGMNLTYPIDPGPRVGMDLHDLFTDLCIGHAPGRRCALNERVVGLRGDLHTEFLTKDPADRFDTPQVFVLVDEGDDHFCGRSNSADELSCCRFQDVVGTTQLPILFLQLKNPGLSVLGFYRQAFGFCLAHPDT